MWLNNDRLSHWLVATLVAWLVWTMLLFLPVFHLWLHFSAHKVIVSAVIGCASQLVFTPWLFSARATTRNPAGKVLRRFAVVIVWLTTTALLFFYYVQLGWPNTSEAHLFRLIGFGSTIVVSVGGLIAVRVISRRAKT